MRYLTLSGLVNPIESRVCKKKHKIISTHLLTVLTISVITAIEQKKRSREAPEPVHKTENEMLPKAADKQGGKNHADQKQFI